MLSEWSVALVKTGETVLPDLSSWSSRLSTPAMDIADHQASWGGPSDWWTSVTSLPNPTIVPSAMALSRIFCSEALSFCMSGHCARGIFHAATYVYSSGFAFTSDICAAAGAAHTADTPRAH